ncbi:MmgE/PrpD family protein [Granulicoccus phenolivorans]|uniref:MmgE/PrpD family protein n=1 Tax=Granulicoccus phenolivorans TaxID=266854 RepID=UPI000400497C|nr:MmgE/PrpD family protein [Granulicoccus phenolivorans]
MNSTPNNTARLASFAADHPFSAISESDRRAGAMLIKDTLACAVAGRTIPSSVILERVVTARGGNPEATVLGAGGSKLPVTAAANINGHLSNAIDSDDTIHYKAHVAAAVIAPALAVAEWHGNTGEEYLAACMIGYEVASRVAMSMRSLTVGEDGQIVFGKVSGYTAVVFGATSATGRLLGLDADRMRHAFGIALASAPLPASSQFGLELPRPMTKYALYGTLAEAGVQAALLAAEGFTSETSVFDGERAFWRVAGSVDVNEAILTEGLGERWLCGEVTYKPYPACRFLNSSIDMLTGLMSEHGFGPDDVTAITSRVHGAALAKHMDSPAVETAVDGMFSLPYLLGAASYRGVPGPNWHTEDARADQRVRGFAEKVTVELEPRSGPVAKEDLDAHGHNVRMPASIEVTVGDQVYTDYREFAHGDPYSEQTRFTDADVDTKFRNFTTGLLADGAIDDALKILDDLAAQPGVDALVHALSGAAR